MKIWILIFFLFSLSSKSQDTIVQKQINSVVFGEFKENISKKRSFKKPKNKLSYFNPFYYVGSGGLFVYQNLISEQLQADCQFRISCSEYTKRSIEKKGVIGLLQGLNQISNCYPKAYLSYPVFLRMEDGRINNAFDYED